MSKYCECCGDLKVQKVYPGGVLETEKRMEDRRVCPKPECVKWVRSNLREANHGFPERIPEPWERFADWFNFSSERIL